MNIPGLSFDCPIKYVAENAVKFSCKTARATISEVLCKNQIPWDVVPIYHRAFIVAPPGCY